MYTGKKSAVIFYRNGVTVYCKADEVSVNSNYVSLRNNDLDPLDCGIPKMTERVIPMGAIQQIDITDLD